MLYGVSNSYEVVKAGFATLETLFSFLQEDFTLDFTWLHDELYRLWLFENDEIVAMVEVNLSTALDDFVSQLPDLLLSQF